MPGAGVAAILGSAFDVRPPDGIGFTPIEVRTPWGVQEVHRVDGVRRPAFAIFRHGLPHRLLPHQINYRAQAAALRQLDCGALLITSSVGVLDRALPLFQPLLLCDLLMLGNRLPDGSPCTMFVEAPGAGGRTELAPGHLVVSGGLFSRPLSAQVAALGQAPQASVVFAYAEGPRTKTAAENRMWAALGAQVNSMTVGPEVVLANELEIPCAGLVVGHKYSLPGAEAPADHGAVSASLVESRRALDRIVLEFLRRAEVAPFENHIFRFDRGSE
jgi:5'-methylthioadenosine phosphorylase